MTDQDSVSSTTKRVNPRQRKRSKSPIIDMSELRIWLLGENWADKISLGNLLLGRNAFGGKASYSCVEKAKGQIATHHISMIITPNLFDEKAPCAEISQALNHCVELSAPGPHVLFLILQMGSFGKNKKDRIAQILNSWSEHALKHTIVILLGTCSSDKERNVAYSLLRESWKYYKVMKTKGKWIAEQSSVNDLFEKIKALDEMNQGNYLILNICKSPQEIPSTSVQITSKNEKTKQSRLMGWLSRHKPSPQSTTEAATPAQTLNLVLFGSDCTRKISTANTILNQTEPADTSETINKCVKREGVVCERPIILVEIPELDNTSFSEMNVMNETLHALYLCSLNVHAFLFVIPVGPLTDDNKRELAIISSIFGTGKFWDYLMILFICEGNRQDRAVTDFLHVSKDIQELIQKCGNKYHILSINTTDDSKQISELLQKIDAIIYSNICYSSYMYVEAQLEKRIHLEARIEQMEKEMKALKVNLTADNESKTTCTNCMRMVLVGKTGSGKSATGNTILNRKAFKSQPSLKSVTSSCQKEEGYINGVPIALVDTPGLFDTQYSNDEVKKEIVNCISLLSPGPHVFLLVLTIGRFTSEEMETLNLIKETFGTNAGMFSIIIFTHGDKLQDMTIESFLKEGDSHIKKLIRDCGERYHVLDNTEQDNSKQVAELLDKISRMIEKNGGGCYTNDMFKEAEAAIQQEMERILQQKKEEMERENKRLREKHEEEMAEMKKRIEEERELMRRERKEREDLLRIKEEFLQNEIRKREEQEEKEKNMREAAQEQRKTEEETQQAEWARKWKDMETKKEKLEEELQKREQEEKERYEKEKRELEERYKERLKKEQQEEEYHEKVNKERSEWAEKQKKIIDEFDQKIKQREAAENERIEEERKERERIEREFENSKIEIRKEREEWEISRKKEWKIRMKEEETRRKEEREKLKKLKEAFEREREEEEAKKRSEDKTRREQEEQQRKEMEEEYKRKLKEMEKKYEDEARQQAEKFNAFREKYNTELEYLMLKHDKEMEDLMLQHQKQYSVLSDLKEHNDKTLNEKIKEIKVKHEQEIEKLKSKHKKGCVLH